MTTYTDGYGGDKTTYVDTWIYEGAADTNYGTDAYMQIFTGSGERQMSLFKFDLSGIPDDATINSATLYLYQHDWGAAEAYTANLHRILAANATWTETGAKWNYATGTTRWAGDAEADGGTDAGCSVSDTDYNAAAIGALSGNGGNASGTEYTITLNTTQVTTMLTADYGLILVWATGGGAVFLWSAESTTEAYRPKLVIDYTAAAAPTAARRLSLLGAGL